MKRKFCVFFLLVLLAMIWISLPSHTVFAATKAEILDQAKDAMRADKSIDQILSQALKAALDSGIALEEIAAPLSETLMQTGIEMRKDGVTLAGQICSSMYRTLVSMKADRAVQFRAISQAVQGIRASAAASKLSETSVRNQIESALTAAAPTTEVAQLIFRVVASTFREPFAETYTPPPPPPPPAPPPALPPAIGDTYDPTASPS